MKQNILIVVLLVCTVQSKYVDYCKIEPKLCTYHVFNVTKYELESFSCLIQPLAPPDQLESPRLYVYTGTFKPHGEKVRSTPSIVNETAVQCELEGIQSALVTLENKNGVALETAFIYPTLCFRDCDANLTCYQKGFEEKEVSFRESFKLSGMYGGCYLDTVCHPQFVLNPANFSEWCTNYFNYGRTWTDTGKVEGNMIRLTSWPVDICYLTRNDNFGTGNIRRASVPEEAGFEGLDLTADGAYYAVNIYFAFTVETNFKIYVKLDTKPIKQTETLLEFPSMLKIQRTPDEAVIAVHTFLDLEANQVVRVVPLKEGVSDGWLQLIGIKMSVSSNKVKRQDTAKWKDNEWNMIGFRYNLLGGPMSLKWFLNGKEVEVDLGNTTGLYLRTNRGPILSHGQFSCFENAVWGNKTSDEEYFKDPKLTQCRKDYFIKNQNNDEPELRYAECEKKYQHKG